MLRRRGNGRKRRIAPIDEIDPGVLDRLAGDGRYVGSAHHKREPMDYGFNPPVNPRTNRSVCGSVKKAEAEALFREGVKRRMVSAFCKGGFPKYVWAVDPGDRAYEAVLGSDGDYHGYVLSRDDPGQRDKVIEEWRKRCPAN